MATAITFEALDAATGDLLWRYSRRLPKGIAPTVKRALGLYGNLVYLPTSDTHIVALDVKSGKFVWDHAVADFAKGYRLTGGPLVVKGKVLVGTTGRAPGGTSWWRSRRTVVRRRGAIIRSRLPESLAETAGTACPSEAERCVGVDSRQLRCRAQPRAVRTG